MAHALQERWSNLLLKIARKKLVTNEYDIFSTDYEGSPKAGAVQIPVRNTEVTVRDYDTATGVALEAGSTSYQQVTISNDKAVNEIIDGYEAEAVPDNLAAQRIDSAAYSMGLNLDSDAIATLEAQGTTSSNTTQSTSSTAYTNFTDENAELDLVDIPDEERWAIVSVNFKKLMKRDNGFVLESDSAFQEVKKAGMVGIIDGVASYKSNNLAADTEFMIGHKGWCQRILEFSVPVSINDLTNTYIGSSAVQGRYVYQHVVTKATAVRVKTFV